MKAVPIEKVKELLMCNSKHDTVVVIHGVGANRTRGHFVAESRDELQSKVLAYLETIAVEVPE